MEQKITTEALQIPIKTETKPQKRQYEKKNQPTESKQDTTTDVSEQTVRVKKQKQRRSINQDKPTFLKAFKIWREKNNHDGILSPKRQTDEYNQVMQILRELQQKQSQ